jgi:hypothetical protein
VPAETRAVWAQDPINFTGLQNCRLSQSDHQAFYDRGIPSALFIWLDYRKPASGICGPTGGTYVTEPEYHTPRDGMNNVSIPRMQVMLDMIGSSFAHNAMNKVDFTAFNGANQPLANANVTGDCGDGMRDFGNTDSAGYLEIRVPHVTCDFKVAGGGSVKGFAVFGDKALSVSATSGGAGASVPATLALTLGTPAAFGAFTPGITKTYTAAGNANVISTAGDATLSVADPSANATGHLVNGTFSLPQPLGGLGVIKTYAGPVSNDAVTYTLTQPISSGDALRTGTYSKTLTFTLSTSTP